jgi:hypothetical protein
MKSLNSQFEGLADRENFNGTVRHIKTVISIVERVGARENLADVVAELVEAKALDKDEVRPVVAMVLGDKFGYRSVAANLESVVTDLAEIPAEIAAWNGIDLVALYSHPDLGVMAFNPKNARRVSQIDRLNRFELVVVYAGRFDKKGDTALLDSAASAAIEVFQGRKPKIKADILKGDCVYKQPREPKVAGEPKPKKVVEPKGPPAKRGRPKASAAGAAAPAAPEPVLVPEEPKAAVAAALAVKPGARMTPQYAVPVTNELFHNGNVEAWKRIIASYTHKHPGLQVMVYYDGERITDINTLFKWGKVKHGSTIKFAVAGEDISDVAKLQRYLMQGASRMFEAFLRGPVNSIMQLF